MANAEFDIPGRVPSAANLREHWRARHARAKRQRISAHTAARFGIGLAVSADVRAFGGAIMLTRVSPRALDSDNLASSLKAIRDGIADALGIDDGDRRISWLYAQETCRKGEECVRVRVGAARAESA